MPKRNRLQYPLDKNVGLVGEGRRYLDHDQRVISLPHVTKPVIQRPSASEKRLSRWLRANLQSAGAEALIRQYGAQAVLDALHDGVVERFTPEPYAVEHATRICPDGDVRRWLEEHDLVPAWRANPELHSPGGFLRHILRGGDE